MLVIAYALLSHELMLHAAAKPWAIAALFAPWLLVAASVGLRRHHWPTLLACAALLALLVAVAASEQPANANRLYVAQHVGIHGMLAWSFGMSLQRGSTALISHMAAQVHGKLSPAMQAYTRRLTAVWAAYFVAMVLLSLALYRLAPWSWWSLFGNLITPAAAIALFVGEHGLRYRWHPEFPHATLQQAVQAYQRMVGAHTRSP